VLEVQVPLKLLVCSVSFHR